MRALHWNGKELRLSGDHPPPEATGRLAVVRVRLAGICSTDLQIFNGYMGFEGVPGHEFVGEVAEGPAHLEGRRVVGEINFACRACALCREGLGRHCPHRSVMGILGADGAFADCVAVPPENLHLVPEAVADEDAVFTEPLAAAFSMLERVHIVPGAGAVVLGDGKLGLLCAQVLHLTGAVVTVVGRHPAKLDIARRLGIGAVLASEWRPAPEADVVVEATGSPAGLAPAMAAVRPRGTLVLKSTVAEDHSLSLAPLVINEVRVVGSRCGLFPPALQALEQQRVSVAPLIDATYPLADGLAAVDHAGRPGAGKVLIQMA